MKLQLSEETKRLSAVSDFPIKSLWQKLGISSVSVENALQNLDSSLHGMGF